MRAPPVEPPPWLRTSADIAWRVLLLAALAYLAVWFLVRIGVVAFPVMVAAILTTLFEPPVRWLEERGMSRGPAAAMVVVGGVLLVSGLAALIVVRFVATAPDLGRSLTQASDQVLGWLSNGPLGISGDQIRSAVSGMLGGGGGSGNGQGSAAGSLISGTRMLVEIVLGFLLMLVVLFFFVKDGPAIVRWLIQRTPSGYRDVALRLGRRTWDVLSRYLRGIAIVAAADAAGTALGLLIIGVPLVVPLTVLVFLGGFIPVVGATVAGLVATLVALVSGGTVDAALTLGLVILVQQIDAHILQPVVMGHEVPLHPVVVLITVAIGATLFAIPGAILAVPVAAVLSAVGNELRLMNVHEAEASRSRA